MKRKLVGVLGILAGIALAVLGLVLVGKIGSIAYALTGIGVVLCLCSLVYALRKGGVRSRGATDEPERERPEYRRKKLLISRVEWDFLQLLRSLLPPDRYEVLVQVPLVAVIDKLTQNSYRNELFRVIDYCIVDSTTYAPLLLVELNDASHTRADRAERDRKVAEICESAGMPLVGFTLAESRDAGTVRRVVHKNMLKK